MNALQQYSILNQIGASQQSRQQQLMEFMLNYKLRQQELEAGAEEKALRTDKLRWETSPEQRELATNKARADMEKAQEEVAASRGYRTAMEAATPYMMPEDVVGDRAISAINEQMPAEQSPEGVVPLYGEGGTDTRASTFSRIMDEFRQEREVKKNALFPYMKQIGEGLGTEGARAFFAGQLGINPESVSEADALKNQAPEYKLLVGIFGKENVDAMSTEEKIANLSRVTGAKAEAVAAGKARGTPVNPMKDRTPQERMVMRALAEAKGGFQNLTEEEIQSGLAARTEADEKRKSDILLKRQKELTDYRQPYLEKLARIKAAAFGENRLYNAYDTETEEPVFVKPSEIRNNPNLVPLAAAEKALTKASIFGEMRVSLQQVRDALEKMPDEFSYTDMVQLQKVLHAETEHQAKNIFDNVVDAAWKKSLSPEKLDYVISLISAYESILSLRTIQGIGQGSETTRAAMRAMAPSGLTPTKDYAKKQLDLVEAEIQALGKGAVKIKPSKRSVYTPTEGFEDRQHTQKKGKLTDPNIAKDYLRKANGDKNKARELAKQDGWEF